VSYLNHGAFGVVPISVQRAQQCLRDEAESNPLKFYAQGLLDRIIHTRRHLAAFLGADPDGSALVPNTTAGISLVLQSVRLAAGDEVLLTDHAYGAVAIAVRRQCRRAGATARTVALPLGAPDAEIVARIAAALRPGRTTLLIVDQLTSATAQVLPVRAIAAAARERDIPVLVDAAHAPGMLPVDVSGVGADFWVGNLHKWAFAPRGTALLAVAPQWRRRIDPLVASWELDAGFPLSVEFQGTLDYTPWLAAPAGLFVLRTLGVEAVRAHNAALAAYGQRMVGAALGLAPADLPATGGMAADLAAPRATAADLGVLRATATDLAAPDATAADLAAPGATATDLAAPGGTAADLAAPGATATDLAAPGATATAMRILPLPAGLATTQAEAHALREHIADKLATETAVTAWGGRGWLRLSAQVYNRPDEYDRLAERLPALLNALQW
jgi:isopenicillin-N epimerase